MMVVDQDIKVGYKQTAVGVIPENWEVRRLKSLLTIGSGKDYKHLSSGNIPVYGSGGLMTHVDEYLFEGKSVCIGRKGTIDKPLFLNEKFWTVDTLYYTYNFIDSLPEYVFFKFQAIDWYRHNEASGVPSLSKSTIYSIKIALPPLPEQRKIAEILSTWDEAIAQTKALIERLKLRNKGLAQQLLTGKKRLKGFSGEWKEVKAEYIFKNHTDKSHNGDLEVLSATQENGVIPRSQNNIDIKFDPTTLHTYKKVEKGDFVISLRSFQGGIEFSEYEGLVSPAYTVLKEVEPISKTFYRIYLKTETFINRLNTIIYGIRDGKQIGYKDFSTLKIPHPSIQEQEGIAEILEVGIQELNGYESHLEFLHEQKKGLMQKLLTGEVRTT